MKTTSSSHTPTPTKAKLTYCQFCEEQIKESGLLSPERVAAVSAAIDSRIVPCCLPDGTPIKNAFVADHGSEGRFVYARCDSPSMVESMRRSCLPAVLTTEEMKLINETCLDARSAELDKERFAKAQKIEAWDGGAWLDDRYFSSMEDLCDHLECEGHEWPQYVWAAKPQTVIDGLDVSDVVEHQICDRGWEDMDTGDLNGVSELQAALDRFVEANASVKSYEPDYRTAILLAPWKQA